MIVGLCFFFMFFFVPETFWDRTPRPFSKGRNIVSVSSLFRPSASRQVHVTSTASDGPSKSTVPAIEKMALNEPKTTLMLETGGRLETQNAESAGEAEGKSEEITGDDQPTLEKEPRNPNSMPALPVSAIDTFGSLTNRSFQDYLQVSASEPNVQNLSIEATLGDPTTSLHHHLGTKSDEISPRNDQHDASRPTSLRSESALPVPESISEKSSLPGVQRYTNLLRTQPVRSFKQTLRPWNGKLRHENWLLVCLRPFILFTYPAILWSTLVYSLSIGWLIVLSESVSSIYRNKATYNFSPLGTGLVYISPFIGGVLGTIVAGKVSDIIVRFMSRRNDGIYEPEFRLVMALPVAFSTCIGLMGFGWSAAEKDNWIVPTVFFGIISFGCSLGSTTAITFAVDSYRQYAGEALVTLNFSKSKSPSPIFFFAPFLSLLPVIAEKS